MKPKIISILILVTIIFLSGFFLRAGNYNLSSPSKDIYYDDTGLQYFQESDSYYNYRLTNNLLYHGQLGDTMIGGRSWDLHSYYPPGVPVDYPPLLSYITVGVYFILNLVTSMSLKEVCLWLPVILGPLAGVVGFLFSRRISSDFGGFITGMLIVTAPLYVFKTEFGFFDTDMLNITLPLLIIWFLFEAENAKTRKNKMLLAGCSGFFLFLFSLAWNGWIYFFYIIITAFIYFLIKEKDFDLVLSFLLVSVCLIGLFNRFGLYNLIMTPLYYLNYFLLGHDIWYPWPDSYKNVAELRTPTIETFINVVSPLTLILGLIGLATIIYSKDADIKPLTRFIIIIWVISSILFVFAGARFVILLIPPLSVLAGVFWQKFENTLKNTLKSIHKYKIIIALQLGVFCVIFLQLFSLFNITSGFEPMYDDYFMEASHWIDSNTSNDTVIVTDWSYGHFFASEAHRPVVFDGRLAYIETLPIREYWYDHSLDPEIPTTARDYWIDLALTTDNYTLSRNIFRMLATSGDNSYLLLNTYTHNKTQSAKILQKVLSVDKESAYSILKENGFSDKEAERLLDYTHPKTSRPFVIVIKDDMHISGTSNTNHPRKVIIYKIINSTILEWNGKSPYSIIQNGTENFIDKKSNFSIIITGNKSLVVDKNYRYTIIIKFLTNGNIGDFIKVFENKKIKIYTIVN